jgi:DNA polymerase-3 subunit chi
MTKVDFYILDDRARGDRYQLACRIAEKARQAGHRVVIHSPSGDEAAHIERLLWTYWEQRFIPHGLIGRDDPKINPILIGDGGEAIDEHGVLINLAPVVPTFFGRFERLAECVDHDSAVKAAGRERFRYYREHGYSLDTHTIQ